MVHIGNSETENVKLDLFYEEMIQFGLRRNPYTLTGGEILDALYHSAEISQDSVIDCLRGKYWELIVEDLRMAVKKYRK